MHMPSRSTTDLTLTLSVADPGFPMGIYQLPRGCTNILFYKSFPENYMKMKKKLDGGVRKPSGSATVCNVDNSVQM